MDTAQFVTILGAVIASFVYLLKEIKSLEAKVDANIKEVRAETNIIKEHMDKFEERMDSHASRIDQLYEMFVDLLKDKKQ